MFRKTALFGFLLSALAVGIGAVAFPPVEKQKMSRHYEWHTRETHKRYWEILPPASWGFTPVQTAILGIYEGCKIHTRRFGFVGLTEYDQMVILRQ